MTCEIREGHVCHTVSGITEPAEAQGTLLNRRRPKHLQTRYAKTPSLAPSRLSMKDTPFFFGG